MNRVKKVVIEIENRLHERKNLAYEQIPGLFHIEYEGEKYRFSQVNDVSISGMGILLGRKFLPQSDVSVSYESDDFNVSLRAKIIWTEQLLEDVYRIGLQFSSDDMDNNIMLFMTLREYIDDFGENF